MTPLYYMHFVQSRAYKEASFTCDVCTPNYRRTPRCVINIGFQLIIPNTTPTMLWKVTNASTAHPELVSHYATHCIKYPFYCSLFSRSSVRCSPLPEDCFLACIIHVVRTPSLVYVVATLWYNNPTKYIAVAPGISRVYRSLFPHIASFHVPILYVYSTVYVVINESFQCLFYTKMCSFCECRTLNIFKACIGIIVIITIFFLTPVLKV